MTGGYWRATRSPLMEGWKTQSLDGEPVAPLMGTFRERGEWSEGTLRCTVFPNFWQHASDDHAVATRITPLDATTSQVDVSWFVHKDAVEGATTTSARLMPFWQRTSEQDWDICEANQAGILSPRYEPGPVFAHARNQRAALRRLVSRRARWTACAPQGGARLSKLPAAARIVIIGGGAIGCSIAYHLAKLGERDVLLLEKKALTAGSTWHAAGLVGQLRSKVNLTRLMQYSAALCASIGAETGQDVGFHKVGSLRLASSDARWEELKRNAAAAKSCGLDVELIGPGEIKEKFPLVDLKDVRGATWIASDGYVDPYSLTMAYAKGARAGGVKIAEGVTVSGFRQANGRITHVQTDQGEVACEVAVNAAGLWARHVGEMAGLELPVTVLEHQYLVTEKSPLIPDQLPTLRDPDLNFYLKSEPGCVCDRRAGRRAPSRCTAPASCRWISGRSCFRRTWSASR